MTYYLYHIPGKKVGVTTNLKQRVHEQQGYYPGEYEIIETSDDIDFISAGERIMQKCYGYKVDEVLYSELKFNNNMNINVTEQTTTFPCPVNKLKGQLMDNLSMKWETEHGSCAVTNESIKWILKNVQTSKYNDQRCYIYNKAFARWFDNNDAYPRTGGIMTDHKKTCETMCRFDKIRLWASERGLYDKGDTKTQALKLVEEVGETCKAILKNDIPEIKDGIGDIVVVLTNLAKLQGTSIEECIDLAYNEIKDRTGKMSNGTFKKD
jgi:NTP pyrophosphatase (non-canonical NTP hydrolase)